MRQATTCVYSAAKDPRSDKAQHIESSSRRREPSFCWRVATARGVSAAKGKHSTTILLPE